MNSALLFVSLLCSQAQADPLQVLYVTGGGGHMIVNHPESGNVSRFGYSVGGGLEYFVSENVTVKAEYMYLNSAFGTRISSPPGTNVTVSTARGGVALHF